MDPSRMIAFLPRTIFGKPVVQQQRSLLLNLTLALVYCIFDELAWPEKVTFSQVCRDLWYQFREKCTSIFFHASSTTPAQRLDYLSVLGRLLPDHYHCPSCGVLHIVDPADLPVTGCDSYGRNIYRTPCPLGEPQWSRVPVWRHYAVAFRHVQSALKYARAQGERQLYGADITRRFAVSKKTGFGVTLDFAARPKIVHGRFILLTTYDFHRNDAAEKLPHSKSMWRIMGDTLFCPHHIPFRVTTNLNDPLFAAARSAFNHDPGMVESQQKFSCDRCPSDYLVVAEYQRLLVSIWQDLGTGASPEDPYWTSHLRDWRGCGPSDPREGEEFVYEHESIWTMYCSDNST